MPAAAAPGTPVPGAAAWRRGPFGQRRPDGAPAGPHRGTGPQRGNGRHRTADPHRLSAAGPVPAASVPAVRAAVLVAGGAAAAAALLGGSAYLMGGDAAPQAGGTPASAFLQRDLAASAPAAVEAGAGTARRLEPHRRTGLHPGRSSHGGAARRPALRGLDLPRAPRTRLPPGLGPGRGAGRRRHRGTATHRRPEIRHHPRTARWPARAVRHAGRARPRTAPPVNVLTGRPATSDGFTAAASPAAVPRRAQSRSRGRGRTRQRDPVGQSWPALRGHLPDRRCHLHLRFGSARGAGRRRRGRLAQPAAGAGGRRGGRSGAGRTSPRGWSAAWAGSWSCLPRDRRFRGGPAPCVTAESSQLRLRG